MSNQDIAKEIAKQNIQELIEKYNQVIKEGNLHKYNEEMTKKDFIQPLFEALGWNIHNKSNRNDSVSAEEQISKSKKRADYGFRINGIPKFFLEAKSLKSDLNDHKYIEQAINYAYHKGCTWTILTNFETIKIYNAEWKTEHPRQAELKSISVQEYIARFEELWLLSKESFEQGLLDKEAEKWGKKTKKTPIDKQLLADFMRFRELLSKNILKLNSNKNLTEEQLDEAVQRMFDRLIFIRNCEDREFEEKLLLEKLRQHESRNRGQLIKDLREIFSYYDKHYNSKIFAHHLCDDLEIDNEVLQEVIEGLNHTKDKFISYDFSAIGADVLGNVYEQYLGYILKKTEKRASLKEAKTKRKEMGIYYTPTYIVDYIVRNTLGELLKDKKVDVSKIRILDPACGSGSFLIKAYDVLYEYYREEKKADSKATILPGYIDDNFAYTIKEKILQDNIFGVDLDKQAVEIAQLNLLLKIAQKGKRLPLLEKNIKCGNSLIDDPAIAGDKAFKWEEEFPQVMKEGGFDVIIGNPPYINNKSLNKSDKEFFSKTYISAYKQYDIALLFIEKSLKLLKDGGRLGFIVSNKFMASDYGLKIREYLLNNSIIEQILDVSYLPVFKDAATYPVVIIIQKTKPNSKKIKENKILIAPKITSEQDILGKRFFSLYIPQQFYHSLTDNIFTTNLSKEILSIYEKVNVDSTLLRDLSTITCGVASDREGSCVITTENLDKNKPHLKYVLTGDISPYNIKWNGTLFIYCNQNKISKDRISMFSGQKILVRGMALRLTAAYDNVGYGIHRVYAITNIAKHLDPKYVLAILNSNLANFYYNVLYGSAHLAGGYIRYNSTYIGKIPIKSASNIVQKSIIELVDKMLSLHKRLNELGDKKTDERTKIEEEIKKTDREIDELVYKLYGITEEEKKIIEESLK